jgi:outer membrane receptor for ferrienterochelin and colicins
MPRSILKVLLIGAIASRNARCASEPAKASIATDLSLEELMSITIVTASKEPEPINEAPGVVSTLSRDEIDRLGPATVRQILATMPGVVASSGYLFGRSSLAVQGDMSKENSSHILILIDGRPIREVLEGGVSGDILEGFPTSAIERIELIKGPGSVLYGSDAFTGVINIVTRRPTQDGAEVGAMTTSDGARRGDATLDLVNGDLKISQSATYDKVQRIDDDYFYRDRSTGAITPLPVHFAPTAYGAHTQVQYREFDAFAGYAQSTSFSEVRGIVTHTLMEKSYANLGWAHPMNEWWSLSVNAGITRAQLVTDTFPSTWRDSYEALLEATNLLKIGKGKAAVGGVATYRNGEAGSTIPPYSTILMPSNASYSGYAQASYPVIDPLLLIGGVQCNKAQDRKPALVPRAGMAWSIGGGFALKALWSNAYRAPSLNELATKGPTLVGNENLLPEKIETWDLALSYNGHDFYSSANAFYSKLTDIIQSLPTSTIVPGRGNLLMYQNAGNLQIMGAGFEIKGYVTKALLVSGSANYQESFDDDGRWDLLPIPLYTGKLGASYVSPMGWELGMSSILLGDYSTKFTTDKVNPAPRGSVQTDLNAKVELGRWLKLRGREEVALRAQIRNLFDEYTSIPEWGGTTQDALPDLRGRSFHLGVEMRI